MEYPLLLKVEEFEAVKNYYPFTLIKPIKADLQPGDVFWIKEPTYDRLHQKGKIFYEPPGKMNYPMGMKRIYARYFLKITQVKQLDEAKAISFEFLNDTVPAFWENP